MEAFAAAATVVFTPFNLLVLAFSIFAGLLAGVIPGMGPLTAIVMLMPFTFNLAPAPAIISLLGMFLGGVAGGSITSILLGIPGTPAAAATVIDGHEMAKKGEAGRAIGWAMFSSFFGGIFVMIFLVIVSPPLARFATKFGPPEIAMLSFMGLLTVASLSRSHVAKGIVAMSIGLLIATVGTDTFTNVRRFTFGLRALRGGIGMIPVIIGVFAVSKMLGESRSTQKTFFLNDRPRLPSVRQIREHIGLLVRSSAIGLGIGTLPGIGTAIASFLAYAEAKRSSKRPELMGTGVPEGVIAPEAANNAVTSGALVPTLTLGIPGDPTTAVLIGALFMQGLMPGPTLFSAHRAEVNAIFLSLFVANFLMLIIGLYGARVLVKAIAMPRKILVPIILVMCFVGTFSVNHSMIDVTVMWIAGILGYVLTKVDVPLPPVVLGLVLGPIIERSFRQSLALSGGGVLIFVQRPISLVLVVSMLLFITMRIYRSLKQQKE
jgi:putative tricarboxylic transport membrane protein